MLCTVCGADNCTWANDNPYVDLNYRGQKEAYLLRAEKRCCCCYLIDLAGTERFERWVRVEPHHLCEACLVVAREMKL